MKVIATALLIVIALIMFEGLCLSIIWNLLIPPLFGIGKLSLLQAIVTLFLINIVTGQALIVKSTDDKIRTAITARVIDLIKFVVIAFFISLFI